MLLKYLGLLIVIFKNLGSSLSFGTLPFCLCLIVADLKFVRRNNGSYQVSCIQIFSLSHDFKAC